MRTVLDVNILEDKAIQKIITRWSFIMLIPLIVGAVVLIVLGQGPQGWLGWLSGFALVMVLYVASLPIHELVHAAFFKLLGPAGTKVRFGFTTGMLYAGCPGITLAPWRFVVVLLAPAVVLSLVFVGLGFFFESALLVWCPFWLHLAGCSGDFYCVGLIATHRETDAVQDTDTGISLLART